MASTPSVVVPVPESVTPKRSAVWAVLVNTVNLLDGAVVPIPTRSDVASIDKVAVSKLSPAAPPLKVTLVSLAKVRLAELKVVVSEELSPMTVLPLMEVSSSKVRTLLESDTAPCRSEVPVTTLLPVTV